MKDIKIKNWKCWLFYSGLALVILAPLLRSGFVLTLDMIFTPKISGGGPVSSGYLFHELLHLLNKVLPAEVIQKLLMFFIMLLSGVGMHRLIDHRPRPRKLKKISKFKIDIVRIYGKTSPLSGLKDNPAVSAYFAGILYVVNPYTYERWMAGHYLLLAGYALLPWLLRAVFQYVNRPSWKGALWLVLYYTTMGQLSIHIFVVAVIAGVVAALVYTLSAPNKMGYLAELLQSGAFLTLFFLVINSFWLSDVLLGKSPISKTLSHFSKLDLEAFTTAAHPQAGLLANVASMYGFWLERFHRYVIPNSSIALSAPLLLILLGLAVFGFRRRFKDDRPQAATILVLGVLGFAIASGIHAPWGVLNEWALLHVPVLKGFREPEKFSALLVMAYCYFGAYGVQALAEKAAAKRESVLNYMPTALLVLPLALVPVMPFGFAGQLKPVHYPQSWYAFHQKIQNESGNYKVLFLPWHQYMSFDFNPRIIANPAPPFFGSKIISGDNAEFGNVFRNTVNPTSNYIEQQILGKASQPDIGTRLNKLHIKYIALAHGADWEEYIFLANQAQLQLVSQDTSLIVYQNTAYK